KPSHIEAAGFRDGVHYVGYGSDEELFQKLDFFLANDSERTRIADGGRDLVQREHTYDNRVAQLLAVINEERKNGRGWQRRLTNTERNYAYCHYYSKHLQISS